MQFQLDSRTSRALPDSTNDQAAVFSKTSPDATSAVDASFRQALPDSAKEARETPRWGIDEVQLEKLSFRVLHPRACGPADVPLIGEAYRCWSDVWSRTLLELDGATQLPSDDFTRQDEVCTIFYGYECVALSCFRYIDLANPMYHDDSYFKAWPASARAAACREGTRLCVGSHITIAPDWRRSFLRSVLTALTLDRRSASGSDAILGTMRDNRGMSKLVARLGGHALGHAELHNVPVTLFALYRSNTRAPLDEREERVVQALCPTVAGGVR
jgi:hypothetical protein